MKESNRKFITKVRHNLQKPKCTHFECCENEANSQHIEHSHHSKIFSIIFVVNLQHPGLYQTIVFCCLVLSILQFHMWNYNVHDLLYLSLLRITFFGDIHVVAYIHSFLLFYCFQLRSIMNRDPMNI